MKYFFYGNFEVKINEKISEIVVKNKFVKTEFSLNSDNLSETILALDTENLFGDKLLFVIDVTDSEIEVLENFLKMIPANCDLVITYRGDLEKSSKILKIIPASITTLEFKKSKLGNVFLFTDYLISKDLVKTYQELKKLDDNEVLIFNNIVSVTRSLLGLKLNLDLKNKILPFKISLFKKAAEKFSEEELKLIYNNLYLNDLKFKKGEITDEMLLLHSVNLFFINKDGNNK
jgi:DNA polymerase III delta subunit